MFKNVLLTVAASALFFGCKKDKTVPQTDPPVTTVKRDVVINFQNYVGTAPLQLSSVGFASSYVNAHGDTFTVSAYKYYVSNLVFIKDNGEQFAEPESYHLIDQNDKSRQSFIIKDIPAGNYTSLKLMIGVDSAKNVSGAQSGDLDPVLGMFWTWSSGYIMAKIEGKSPQIPSSSNNAFSFHMGGFSGQYNVLQTVTLTLPQPLTVTASSNSTVTVKSDVLKWFAAPHLVDFSVLNEIGVFGQDAKNMSDNYSSMFSVTKVEN